MLGANLELQILPSPNSGSQECSKILEKGGGVDIKISSSSWSSSERGSRLRKRSWWRLLPCLDSSFRWEVLWTLFVFVSSADGNWKSLTISTTPKITAVFTKFIMSSKRNGFSRRKRCSCFNSDEYPHYQETEWSTNVDSFCCTLISESCVMTDVFIHSQGGNRNS